MKQQKHACPEKGRTCHATVQFFYTDCCGSIMIKKCGVFIL